MISVDEHRTAITELLGTRPQGELPLERCSGLVTAHDIPAGVALPPFDNSAMDGYAVRAAELGAGTAGTTAETTAETTGTLPVAEDIPAGRTDVPALSPGTAHRIMTGAPLPAGADTVVKVEDTDGGTETVRFHTRPTPGAHIRRAGEDIARGSTALPAGTPLGPGALGLAAALGLDTLTVHTPPRVLVVSTGTELVLPPEPLRHGQIYESNSIMLRAALHELGCEVRTVRSLADDVRGFRETIEPELSDTDLLVTSGGVSAGAYEVVKDALGDAGVRFGKVAMQPGGPQGWGRYRGVPTVTLPGNPVSVLVSYEAFLRPALLAALGHSDTARPHARAVLTEPLSSPWGKRQFRRGSYTPAAGGATGTVAARGGAGSHLLAAFTGANCLIELPEDTTEVPSGEVVDVALLG